MMNRLRATAAAVALEVGKSDVAVLKAAKDGRISRNADGTFDIDRVKVEWAQNTNPHRGGDHTKRERPQPVTPAPPAPPEQPIVSATPIPSPVVSAAPGIARLATPRAVSAPVERAESFAPREIVSPSKLMAARTIRETYEAQIAKLKYETQRGTLINKAGAERAVSAGFRLLRDTILGVPDRLPLEHAQRIEFRRALEAAFSDAEKMMAPKSEPVIDEAVAA